MSNLKRIFLTAVLALSILPALAQDVEMADTMRSEGKIYVLLAIILVILAGLITYLVVIDRKVQKLEKKAGVK